MNEIEALAETWASIDGKQADFSRCKIDSEWEDKYGHYEGYMAEAEEMIGRLKKRGYQLVRVMDASV